MHNSSYGDGGLVVGGNDDAPRPLISWDSVSLCVKHITLESDMEIWTCFKLGKEYIKVVYCHLAYLTYIQST